MSCTTSLSADITTLVAPQLLGTLFNLALYGVLAAQVVWSLVSFPSDRQCVKVIICVVFALETLQTTLVIYDAYRYLATGFGDLERLNDVLLQWLACPVITGIVSCISQLFFTYRLVNFSCSKALAICAVLLALLQMACGIAEGARFYLVNDFRLLASKTAVTSVIWLIGSALCDVILAATMTFLLVTRDTKIHATHAIISRLIMWTVGTGAITALAATADLVLFLVFSRASLHRGISVLLSKVYSISVLFVQNQRAVVRRRITQPDDLLPDLPSIAFRVSRSSTFGTTSTGQVVEGELVRMEALGERTASEDEQASLPVYETEPPKKSHELANEH